jgi:hypothetical protein
MLEIGMRSRKTSRRQILRDSLAAVALAAAPAKAAATKLGIPGPYPGRVVAVSHPGVLVSGAYQAEPVREMMRRGMTELTGADGWADAWRAFFEPGDVVAIKVCPVGGRYLCSDALVLHEIIAGLLEAGVRRPDIVVYNRYRRETYQAGIHQWLPEGIKLTWASEAYNKIQQDIGGYDPDVFIELALAVPGQDIREERVRRSYVARVLTRQVNKVINLPVLKHHQASGVTIALKNLSHGFVNNVERSHATYTLNATGTFIPAVVSQPVFREKVVLHIVDGVRAQYHGGPGGVRQFMWEHKTMYFGTDPVALDKVGWKVLDEERAKHGLAPIALSKPDAYSHFLNCQVEHIELAGALGLGEFDDAKIDVRRIALGA